MIDHPSFHQQNKYQLYNQSKRICEKQGQIIIKNHNLIIDNYIVPYENQVIYDNNKLYLAELGREVLIDETILIYDDYFFDFNLQKQLVEELEVLDSSTGLEMIKIIPNLKQNHFSYLLEKLTIQKITKILLHDQFYLFLIKTFQNIIFRNSISSQDQKYLTAKSVIQNMTSIYQRIFYLLENIEGTNSQIRNSLEVLANQMMLTLVSEGSYIKKLAYTKQRKDEQNEKGLCFDVNFLTHLINAIIFMQYIASSFVEQEKLINGSYYTSLVNQLIFTKECLNIIAGNFSQLFLYHRKKLLLSLCFICKLDNFNIWTEVISYDYIILQPKSNKQVDHLPNNSDHFNQFTPDHNQQKKRVNNQSAFKNLIMNSYLNCTSDNWSMGLYLLEEIGNPKVSMSLGSFDLMITIYEEIIQLGIGIQEIDAITEFIIQHKSKIKQQSKLRLLVCHFLEITNRLVQRLYKDFEKHKTKFIKWNIKKCQKAIISYRLNTKLISCLLRTFSKMFQKHIFKTFLDYEYLTSIHKLFQLSRYKKGLVESARRNFVRLIKEEYAKQGEKSLEKKRLSGGLLESYCSKRYHLNQKKGNETTMEKLMKILEGLKMN